MSQSLPPPTSGASVASYIALCLLVAVVVLLVLLSLGSSLTSPVEGLRVALGMRPT
ncbi:MAG: hypothetical protein ACYDEA_02745 [Candidatus Dormibacteria bacterium]